MIIHKEYLGFRIRQRENDHSISFFVFVANAKDVNEWSAIDRLEEREGGIQRRLSQARLRAIHRFFDQDDRNLIPTSIVVAFKPGITNFAEINFPEQIEYPYNRKSVELGILSFEFDTEVQNSERPALIVDGQHRLLGMAGVEEDLPIIISALLDAESNEQAFQFIVINNKVTRVPSDLVRSLIVDFDENDLQLRLETARVSLQPHALLVSIVDDDVASPFYQMVDWERRRGTGNPAIKPAAIEDGLKYIRHRFPSLDEDTDGLLDFFFGLWSGVKKAYPQLWEQPNNRLFENAGFKAFSIYLTDQIETLAGIEYVDINDPDSIAANTKIIAEQINQPFWLSVWQLKSLDTSGGREVILDDIKHIRLNQKERIPWYTGLNLIDSQNE